MEKKCWKIKIKQGVLKQGGRKWERERQLEKKCLIESKANLGQGKAPPEPFRDNGCVNWFFFFKYKIIYIKPLRYKGIFHYFPYGRNMVRATYLKACQNCGSNMSLWAGGLTCFTLAILQVFRQWEQVVRMSSEQPPRQTPGSGIHQQNWMCKMSECCAQILFCQDMQTVR